MRLLRFSIASFVAGLSLCFAAPALSAPKCDTQLKSAIHQAHASHAYDLEDALKSLRTYPIMDAEAPKEVLCGATLSSDLVRVGARQEKWGPDFGGQSWWFPVTVRLNGREHDGWLSQDHRRSLEDRNELTSGKPFGDPIYVYSAPGQPDEFLAGYGIDAKRYMSRRQWRLHPLQWINDRIPNPLLLSVAVILFAFARFSLRLGLGSYSRVSKQFRDALGAERFVRIGGVWWLPGNTHFSRVYGFNPSKGRWWAIRYNRKFRVHCAEAAELIRQLLRYGGPASILAVAIALYTSDDPTFHKQVSLIGVIEFGCLLTAAGAALETIYSQGWQWLPGAIVLDPDPEDLERLSARERMDHGDARVATEREVQKATVSGGQRSPIHDQEFD